MRRGLFSKDIIEDKESINSKDRCKREKCISFVSINIRLTVIIRRGEWRRGEGKCSIQTGVPVDIGNKSHKRGCNS